MLQFVGAHGLSHEHHWRRHVGRTQREIHSREEVAFERELDGATLAGNGKVRALAFTHAAHHGHALEIRATVAGRLEAELSEPRGDVQRCNVEAARPGLPALEQVVGEEAHVGLDAGGRPGALRLGRWRCRACRLRHAESCGTRQDQRQQYRGCETAAGNDSKVATSVLKTHRSGPWQSENGGHSPTSPPGKSGEYLRGTQD